MDGCGIEEIDHFLYIIFPNIYGELKLHKTHDWQPKWIKT